MKLIKEKKIYTGDGVIEMAISALMRRLKKSVIWRVRAERRGS